MEGQAFVLHFAAITLGTSGIRTALDGVLFMLDRKYSLAAICAGATLGYACLAIDVWHFA